MTPKARNLLRQHQANPQPYLSLDVLPKEGLPGPLLNLTSDRDPHRRGCIACYAATGRSRFSRAHLTPKQL